MQIALITGASGGMGTAMVNYLASKNITVIATDKNDEIAHNFSDISNVFSYKMDITNPDEIKTVFNEINEKFGHVNVLINNAGIMKIGPLTEDVNNEFHTVLKTNVIGAHQVTQIFFPLIEKVKGRIINISSESVKTTVPFFQYTISKKSLEAWHQALYLECYLLDMKAILIRPGAHKTDLLIARAEIKQDSRFRKELETLNNQYDREAKNPNDPVDVAKVVWKAITAKNPKRIYHVNNSIYVNLLKIIPDRLYAMIIKHILQK